MNQEQLINLQIIEQEANQLSQQSEMIEKNLSELQELKEGLEEIGKEETKEVLVNIGKKIYLPVAIKEKELIVEVGGKNFTKKTISETNEIVEEQLKKLISAKLQIMERLQELESQMNLIVNSINSESKKEKHDDNCEGEDK